MIVMLRRGMGMTNGNYRCKHTIQFCLLIFKYRAHTNIHIEYLVALNV